ncbi:uncharacterized protein [Aegilops tauschii subsp. strangulata]|uniref:uncharacterized protein n=1 Tax=Aegilops tauschii subsp. strangulata TaxID=200361 RepID=UPI003CC8E13B
MDDFLNTIEYHPIVADGNTKLDVWNTNEPGKVEETIALYEDWLREEKYKFVGLGMDVGVKNVRDALFQDFIRIPEEYHIDIQEKLMIKGGEERDSMEDLAGAIIDESYLKLESSFPELLCYYWDWKPLTFDHLKYGAAEGYVSYELYHRFLSMRDILHCRDGNPV